MSCAPYEDDDLKGLANESGKVGAVVYNLILEQDLCSKSLNHVRSQDTAG